jgi:simple sugar transport system permease protein
VLGARARGAAEALAIPTGALGLSLILFGMFVALTGNDPLAVYGTVARGAFGNWFSIQNTLQRSAPLMLTALCTALPAALGLIVTLLNT